MSPQGRPSGEHRSAPGNARASWHALDPRQPWLRRAVLTLAVTLALVAAMAHPGSAPVRNAAAAEKAAPPAAKATLPADPPATPAQLAPAPPAKAAAPAPAPGTPDLGAGEPADPRADADTEVTIDHRGIGILKNGKRVQVRGLGADREYDSFRDFINDAPWMAALVFLLVLLFFLTPLLILVLVIWYKMRKTRMQNETMLKLAEKGVVPPAEAMQALSGQPPPSGLPPSMAPLYEQARLIRRRAAWSDLRKGVVLIAVGLGFIFYSMLGDGEPNWVGLICLFLGIGYCVLWFFEDRHTGETPGGAGTPPAGGA